MVWNETQKTGPKIKTPNKQLLPIPKLKPQTMSPSYREEEDFEVMRDIFVSFFVFKPRYTLYMLK